jgi:hypothetical protein
VRACCDWVAVWLSIQKHIDYLCVAPFQLYIIQEKALVLSICLFFPFIDQPSFACPLLIILQLLSSLDIPNSFSNHYVSDNLTFCALVLHSDYLE